MRLLLTLSIVLVGTFTAWSQIGTEFWFAAPEATESHDTEEMNFRFSTFDDPATVTIDIPANGGWTPIVINIPANSQHTEPMDAFLADLETVPFDQVLTTGVHITSTADITAYYELDMQLNPDIFALKADNALGNEFYIPYQNLWPNQNFGGGTQAYAQFNIVATEDNTTIWIFPKQDLLNHPASVPYSITLDAGETYSGRADSFSDPALRPTGTVVSSDKPIAITYGDDSVRPAGEGCYDFYGDQLVPTDIIGSEYIVNSINGDVANTFRPAELAIIVATENFTTLNRNGVFEQVLFAGQTIMDTIVPGTEPSVYYQADKPFYLIHLTGFGCEMGSAILPPLNCAGSSQVSFTRSTTEGFFLSILIPSGAEGDFELNGDPTLIEAGDFSAVPGTGGAWMTMFQQYPDSEVPVNVASLVTNSSDVFSLGIVNGGINTGTRFGYFSKFSADILVDAGTDVSTCSGNTVPLSGSVSGGVTTGLWSTINGSGTFDNDTDLGTTYNPTISDYALGSIDLVLESTGNCFAVYDTMTVTFTPAPTIDVGIDQTICANNEDITVTATSTVAAGLLWTAGTEAGSYSPNNTTNPMTYTPSTAEISSGSIQIYATTTGIGDCQAVTDTLDVDFVTAPVVEADGPYEVCANDPEITLAGSVTTFSGFGTGIWSGGAGAFDPGSTALGALYAPSAAEISSGNLTLTLTSTNNGICNAEADNANVTITDAPTVNAGVDQNICSNNADVTLNGSFTIATGAEWVGGNGTFNPDRQTMGAVYTPTQAEIISGSLSLTLSTTGNGLCTAETDDMTITFTPAPTSDAGTDETVCANNEDVTLGGAVTTATSGEWSGGLGNFSPSNTSLAATYTPSAAEITAGTVRLFLTTTGNGNCVAVVDSMDITIEDAPVVTTGGPFSSCANNPDVTLSGSVVTFSGAGSGDWSGGLGTFDPNNSSLNAIYTPSVTEINNGTVNLTLTSTSNGICNAEASGTSISISAAPTVNAGPDQSICANNADVTLAGSVTVATGAEWLGGFGTFTPNRQTLNAVYTPTASEISSGSLDLTLSTTGNGTCTAETDEMTITFTAEPTANAGVDETVCANNEDVTLGGSVTIASGGQWTGGSGAYSPNSTSLNATYTPTSAEITAGTVRLYLTTTGIGNCNEVVDSLDVTITSAPVVEAGGPYESCANNPDITMGGSVITFSGFGTGDWTGTSGSFNPGPSALNAIYTPTATEINNGSVNFTLTSTNNGDCNTEADVATLTIDPAPTVDAGVDQIVCANNSDATLSGSATNQTAVEWQGGLGVFTPNRTTLNPVYTPTQSEINLGFVDLTLEVTGEATCTPVTDDMRISFSASPTVDAGPNQSVCANNEDATLNGSFTVSANAEWTNFDGTWVTGDELTMNSTYRPSATEITAGQAILFLTTIGNGTCNAVSDSVILTIDPAPTVDAGLDATSCFNNATVSLGATFSDAGGIEWTGNGTFIPNIFDPNATYTPTQTEINAGFASISIATTANGNCNAVGDNLSIVIGPAPTADAGIDQTVCANNATATLNGGQSGATGIQWSGGLGIFSSTTDPLADYTPTQTEINSGSVDLYLTTTGNGNCSAEQDTMTISFTAAPTADAGANTSVCANNQDVSLTAAISVATGVQWTGDGTFSPNSASASTVYTPSAAEITAGQSIVFLSTTGNGNCAAVEDSIIITITDAPTVEAGTNLSACENNSTVNLGGSFTGAGGVQWSNGSGSFIPSVFDQNAQYAPSTAEISSGLVSLILTTTGNGNCNAVSDVVQITINPAPTVDAGTDETFCGNNADINLNGSVTLATGGQWSGGLGIFNPGNTTLSAVYTPSATEVSNGSVTLTLSSTGNGDCIAVQDNVTFTLTPSPIVSAGLDQSVCSNNPTLALDGSFSVATGIQWIGGSGSFNPDNTTANATYTPTATEISSGSINLKIQSTGNGLCVAEQDSMTISFTPSPFVEAGPDQSVCVDELDVQLGGFVSGATTTGSWASTGTGFFVPNQNDLNATYRASTQDSINGGATISLTSTNNGNCLAESDNMAIVITTAGVATAGIDQTVCANDATITLNGNVTGGALSGVWTTTGSGQFSPNNSTLNASYVPSAQDTANGGATFTLTANSCNVATDEMDLTITPAPQVDAGVDQLICVDDLDVVLDASVGGASNSGLWRSSGTGSFDPGSTTVAATYQASSQDSINGSVTLILEATGIGSCLPVEDTVLINILPGGTANAGSDQTVCANDAVVTINGIVGGGALGGTWTSSGTGTFSPDANTLSATYTPSTADITAGTVTLTLTANSCDNTADDMVITITPAPVVVAGTDAIICENNASLALNGSVTVATGGIWTTSGAGSFSPSNTILNPTYNAAASDTLVTLYLTSFGNGNCTAVVDTFQVDMISAPLVDAGTDIDICAGTDRVTLAGTISNGTTSGIWSTNGSGGFDPGNTVLGSEYVLSNADSANGGVTLTLTSTNNGLCNAVTDNVVIAVTEAGGVSTLSDTSICANNTDLQLSGSTTGNVTVTTWSSTGDGSFSPSVNDLNAIYTPGTTDSTSGSFTIRLGGNSCNAPSDQFDVSITSAPFVQAGPDQTNCINDLDFALDGIVAGASSTGIWSTSGTGSFLPNNATLNAIYQASANDSIAGAVTLTLFPSNIGNCSLESDALELRLTTGGTATAGNDQVLCRNNSDVQLNGTFSGGATLGTWSTSGTGSFSPDVNTTNAVYTPSGFDLSTGNVTITFTANSCDFASDNMEVTFTDAPTLDAGDNQSICENNPAITLDGSFAVASGLVWTSDGTGLFTPNNTDPNAVYTPSSADLTSGSVKVFATSTGNGNCIAVTDSMVTNFTGAPNVNAGLDQSICKGTSSTILQGSVTLGASSGEWTTLGSGTFASNSSLFTEYTFSDQDTTDGAVTILLTSTSNGNCVAVTDTMIISFNDQGGANAGTDQSVCANNLSAQLDGTLTGGATSAIWTTSGDGSFSPSNATEDPVYIPGPIDSVNTTVTLTMTTNSCNAASDNMVITISPAPQVNAGPDQVNCVNDLTFDLDGTVSGFTTTGQWATTGTGTFSDANALDAEYTASPNDSIAGSVDLILTATNIGNCTVVADTMTVRMTTGGTVNAGNDQVVCDNNSAVQLNGSFTGGATQGTWNTSGTGSFSPDNTTLNAIYNPSSFDLALGSVQIGITANSCDSPLDDLTVTFTDGPTVEAGNNQSICENNTDIPLAGSVTVATGGLWSSSGTGNFVPSANSLTATYQPSPADVTNGEIVLYLATTGNGDCVSETDSLEVKFTPDPVVDAGVDFGACASDASVNLSGLITEGTITGRWATLGTGTFTPNDSTLFPTYNFSSADSAAGSVEFVLTSTNNGNCLEEDDTVTVTFTEPGTVDAGIDQTVCSNNIDVQLAGSITGGATVATWSTSGDGIFLPDENDLNAVYAPGIADSITGAVTLSLASNACNNPTDQLAITITPSPVVAAGPDQTNCVQDLTFDLDGTVAGASTTGAWTSNGTGSFVPDNTTLNASYVASANDSIAGNIQIILAASNIGNCTDVQDTLQLRIAAGGTADAGNDQVVCGNSSTVQLNGSFTGGADLGTWASSGTGFFSPDNNDMNATYSPSDFDRALGSVTVTLTTNSCDDAQDEMIITFTDAPVVDAGDNASICENNNVVSLNGAVSIATGGLWTTSGTGSFAPSNTDLNATYTPSQADLDSGRVTLFLTSTGNGTCNATTDSLSAIVGPAPVVNAGSNQQICISSFSTNILGSITGGSITGRWATLGTGSFFPNDSSLSAEYVFSSDDTTAREVELILTSTNNGNCLSEDDTLTITLGDSPFVNAGEDQSICADDLDVALSGFITGGATMGTWTALNGSGSFSPDENTLSTTYTLSPADSLNGEVNLMLTSTNNGGCTAGSDTMTITLAPVPTVEAGINRILCLNADTVELAPQLTDATTATWSTSGTGNFSPNANTLNAVYTISETDRAFGSISLTLSTAGDEGCFTVSDNVIIALDNPLEPDFVFGNTCFGSTVNFVDSTEIFSGDISTWSWDFGDGATSNAQFPSHEYTAEQVVDVKLVVTASGGCSDSITKSLTVHPLPTAGFREDSDTYLEGTPINFLDESSGAVSYRYIFGSGQDTSFEANPTYTYASSGSYTVTQRVVSDQGCSDSSSVAIDILSDEVFPPVMPTAFSPNEDGVNDTLLVRGGPFISVRLQVWNEWGQQIFSTESIGEGWDGTYNGEPQPVGSYVYTVEAITATEEKYTLTGDISLIR